MLCTNALTEVVSGPLIEVPMGARFYKKYILTAASVAAATAATAADVFAIIESILGLFRRQLWVSLPEIY